MTGGPEDAAEVLPAAVIRDLDEDDRAVVAAVGAASRLLTRMQSGIASGSSVTWKADGTPVTAADLASEATIVAAIEGSSRGGYRLVAEERPETGADAADAVWFVDPLDGTRAYRSGSSDYAILVSRWQGGRPRFSIAHYPALGSWLVVSDATVRTAGAPPAENGTVGRSCLCYMDESTKMHFSAANPEVGFITDEEATTALFELALGRVEAVAVQVRALKSWDIAPLVHAVEASGGRICDERGRRIILSEPTLSARFILAARTDHQLRRLLAAAAT